MTYSLQDNFLVLEDDHAYPTNYGGREQGIPLRCWGRIGFKTRSLQDIFIPQECFTGKRSETPEVKTVLLHKLETNDGKLDSESSQENLTLSPALSVSSLSVSSSLSPANTDNSFSEPTVQENTCINDCHNGSKATAETHTSCDNVGNHDGSNLISNLPRNEEPQFESIHENESTDMNFNSNLFVVLPRKNEESTNSRKAECRRKKKNRKEEKLLLSSVFIPRENVPSISQSRNKQYTLQLNCLSLNDENKGDRPCLPSVSDYYQESANYVLPNHYNRNEIYDSDLDDSAEFPCLPEPKGDEVIEKPSIEKKLTLTDVARSLLVAEDNTGESVDTQVANKRKPVVPGKYLVVENVPKVELVEIKSLLQSYGPIEEILYEDQGECYNITLYIDADLEWMVECLNDMSPFGEFSNPLRVYIKENQHFM